MNSDGESNDEESNSNRSNSSELFSNDDLTFDMETNFFGVDAPPPFPDPTNFDDAILMPTIGLGNHPYLMLPRGDITRLPARRNAHPSSIYWDILSSRSRTPPTPTPRRSLQPPTIVRRQPTVNRQPSTTLDRQRHRFDEVSRLPTRSPPTERPSINYESCFLTEEDIFQADNSIILRSEDSYVHHPIQSNETYERILEQGVGHSNNGAISYNWSDDDEIALREMIRQIDLSR